MSHILSKEVVRKIALDNKFKFKLQEDGSDDLNPYVFDFVDAIIEEVMKVTNDEDVCSCGHYWNPSNKPPTLHEEQNTSTFQLADFDVMFGNMKTITDANPDNFTVTPVDCALVLIIRNNKILGVSRKNDHTDIGLPGGKCELGETFRDCAVRETAEETDFTIKLLDNKPFDGIDMGLSCRTYLAEITGKVSQARDPSETGLVGFFDKQELLDGSFGEYNKHMFKHFGI